MKSPLSWKNLTTVLKAFMTRSPKAIRSLLNSLGCRHRHCARCCGAVRRRHTRLDHGVVAPLPAEHVAIDRRQRLVQHTVQRAAGQVARPRVLPRHDVEELL